VAGAAGDRIDGVGAEADGSGPRAGPFGAAGGARRVGEAVGLGPMLSGSRCLSNRLLPGRQVRRWPDLSRRWWCGSARTWSAAAPDADHHRSTAVPQHGPAAKKAEE
jgi:hypothetical protein